MGQRFLLLSLALALSAGGCGDASSAPPGADGGVDAGACARACDDGLYCNGTEHCDPTSAAADEDGCVAGEVPCAVGCVEATASCGDPCPDADRDGAHRADCGGTDCDDTAPAVHPGASEVCDTDGIDEDCNPATFGVRDADGDSYADATCCNTRSDGTRVCGPDCDDTSGGVHPALAEVCDMRDNDCDASIDEGVVPTWHPDLDGDGNGDPAGTTRMDCLSPGPGWSDDAADCDDTRDDVHPGLPELCNGRDDNCQNGTADEVGCACITGTMESCGSSVGACRVGTRHCIAGAWGPCGEGWVGASPEACDPTHPGPAGVDEDCDGMIDEGLVTSGCYADADMDSYGTGSAGYACAALGGGCPPGTATRGGDCDDARDDRNPGRAEVCNVADDDCDARTDEGLHVRRVDVAAATVDCGGIGPYGRDMSCEQAMSAACGTLNSGNYCTIGQGWYVAAGGNLTLGCAQPVLYRSDIQLWELTARHAGCDGTAGDYNACQSAAHRYCGVFGYVTGYTTRLGTNVVSLSCFDTTQVATMNVTWAQLDARDGAAEHYCAGPSRDGWWCTRAVDAFCREQGFVTGFGPMEYTAGGGLIACLRSY